MKAVILAGGLGTRLSEETHTKPKPMIEIGGKPIIWHIMKLYSFYGINDFIICCGYKGYMIKEYFANYFLHTSDVTFHMDNNNHMQIHKRRNESWKVTLVDTGELSQTGGRLARVKDYLIDGESFCFTYGDGISNVNIKNLVDFHHKNATAATLTAVQPPGRFGALDIYQERVQNFHEKPEGDNAWINGGFFVLETSVIERIKNDMVSWEQDILPQLALEEQLSAFCHKDFWQPMDTLRDRKYLESLWSNSNAPWKVWH